MAPVPLSEDVQDVQVGEGVVDDRSLLIGPEGGR